MIEFRQKEFIGLQDGYGGKLGKIKKSGKKSDSYKNFGPWEVRFCEAADDEFLELEDKDANTVREIKKHLEKNPFFGKYGQHPLWEFYDEDNECVVWSAKINDKDRLTYLIFKFQNIVLITNLIGHNVINLPYAQRPNIWK